MKATHVDAEQRYDKLRKLAIEYAHEGSASNLKLTVITPDALSASKI